MPNINDNYLKLKAGYLFPEIGRRVKAFAAQHPEAKIIRMGIGDVTEPLAPAVVRAMHKAVDEMAGRATFKVDGEEHDAPPGTLVHCPPGTLREAFAAEPGTTVLGIGAKPGEVFQPSGWEWSFAGTSLLAQGDEEGARRELQAGIETYPDAWQGYYNLACVEARLGNTDEALAHLERAAGLEQEAVAKWAREDSDLESLRGDQRFLALTGQSDADGASS